MAATTNVTNKLAFAVSIYDSYAGADNKSSAQTAYYGNLTLLGTVAAGATSALALKHDFADVLLAFDASNAPLARYAWSALDSDTPGPFTVGPDDVTAMTQSAALVKYIAQNGASSLARNFMAAKDKGPDATDAFLKTQSDFSLCTYATYMLALTNAAQTPPSVSLPPPQKVYALSSLVESIGGIPWPDGLPDILVSNFSCKFSNGVVLFGATINLKDMPFQNDAIANHIFALLPVTQVDVQVSFSVQLGPNLFGTDLTFLANDFHIPVGGGKQITITRPTVKLDITPAFKFVVFTVSAVIPFAVFGRKFNATISMLIDNIEAEIGAVVDGLDGPLITPPVMKGVHLDEFGIGMGIIFEPPGYALGLQGKFHIGDGNQVVALDDDTFVLVCEMEEDVPNPLFLSFYVPKLDIATLVTVFTNVSVGVDFPVDFDELSFVWSEDPMEPVALPDGTLSQGGYGFSGFMHLFGLKFYTNAVLNLGEIKAQAVMAPFNLGGLLTLAGDSPAVVVKIDAAGNIIRNNQIATTQAAKAAIADAKTTTLVPAGGAELAIDSSTSPWFRATAKVSFLDIVQEKIDATIDRNGIRFELDYGSILSSKFIATLQNFDKFTGSFTYGPDFTVPLPTIAGFSLGSIHIHDTVTASLTLGVSSSQITLGCSGGFDFQGLGYAFGPFNMDINITRFSQVLDGIEHEIVSTASQIFAALIQDAEKWAGWVKNQIVAGVGDVVSGLKTAYQKTAQEAADILHAVGYDADFIAQGLRGIYGVGSEAVAGILKGYGYAAGGVAEALKYAGYGANEVASALKQVAYAATDVANALASAFGMVPSAVSTVMQGVGYAADTVKDAFNDIGGDFASFASSAWGTIAPIFNPSHW